MDKQNLSLFRQKAETYLVCYNDKCPHCDQCLRRLLAAHVPATRRLVESVNPAYADSRADVCEYYRPADPVVMHSGLTHFYDDIPEAVAHRIRTMLRSEFGNSVYYRLRNGQLPITPAVRQRIAAICRHNGWTGTLLFDGETIGYVW
ncbi:MAG: hypothetical protein IJ710_10905 [Prevotella sp.]|nr:hypothetical protein [Prevotella sp.]